MFEKAWGRPLKRGAHVDGGGATKRRILATLAIAAMTVTNLGAGALAAPAANAQEFTASSASQMSVTKKTPKIAPALVEGESDNRWTSRLFSAVSSGADYSWLTGGGITSSAYGPTFSPQNGPEFTGPFAGDVGLIQMVGTQQCLLATTQQHPSFPSPNNHRVDLAACDEGNPRQQWSSTALPDPTPLGRFVHLSPMDPALSSEFLLVAQFGGLVLTVGPGNPTGILDPAEQTAPLNFTYPAPDEVIPSPGPLVVTGTGRPNAQVQVYDGDDVLVGTATVQGDATWALPEKNYDVGSYSLRGSMDSKPASVNFSVGDRVVSAANSTITVDESSRKADGIEASVVTVVLRDSNGVPVGNNNATAVLTTTLGDLSPTTTNDLGTFTASLTSEVAGTATVGFKLGETAAPATESVEFVAGDVDFGAASGTKYEVSTGDVIAGSGSHTATVIAKDAKGNGVPLANPATQITADYDPSGGFLVAPFEATDTVGVYEAEVTSPLITSRAITVKIDGQPVTAVMEAGEPVNTASFIAGPADLTNQNTGFTVTVPSVPVVDGSHTVTVELVDGTGLPVTLSATDLGKLAWTAAPEEGVIPSAFTAVNGVPGSYEATIKSTKADTNTITVSLNGVTVNALGNDQAAFHADTPATGNPKTNYQVTDTEETVGTGKHTVTIRMVDANDNPVEDLAWDDFALTAAPTAGVAFDKDSFVETDPGVYTVKVSSTSAGSKKITVALTAGGALNPAKTGEVTANIHAAFKAAAVSTSDNSKTNFTVTGTPVVVGGHHTVTVKLADEYGNPVTGLVAAASLGQPIVTGDLGTGVPTGFIEDPEEPGTFTATMTSTQKGDKLVEVKLAGATVLKAEGGNDTAVFTAGAASALESSLTLSAGPIHANGVDKAVAMVTLKDEFGNAITTVPEDTTVEITADPASATVSTTIPGNTAGTFTADITSETAGEVTVSFTVNGEEADASESVEFLVTAAPGVKYANGFSVAGTGVKDQQIVIRNTNGDVVGNGVVGDDGKFLAQITGTITNGEVLDVVAVDPVHGFESRAVKVTVDSDVPGEPVVDPSNGSEITGTTKPGSTVVVKDEGDNILCETTADAEDGSFSCVPNRELGHGEEITVEVTDASGNKGEQPGSVIIDKEAPKEPIVDPSNGEEITGNTKPDSKVTVKDEEDNILCETVADKNGDFSCVPNPKPGHGEEITVEVVDPSGNQGEKPGSVIIDKEAPKEPIVDPSNGSEIKGETKPGSSVTVKDDEDNTLCETVADKNGKFSCVPEPKPGHGDKIIVEVVDPSGNQGEKPGSVIIDKEAPKEPIVDPSNGSEIKGETKPGSSVTVKDDEDNILCETVADKNGKFSCVPEPRPEDGDTITVEVVDPSGNQGEKPGSVVIDRVAPNAPVVNPSNGSQISGTGEAGAKAVITGPNGVVLCETTVNAKGQFACVPKPKPEHGAKITVTLTDPSGNVSDPGTVIINAVPPTAPIVDVSNGKKITGGVIKTGNTVIFVDGKGQEIPGVTVVDSTGRFTFTPTKPLAEGADVRVVVTDPEGNTTEVKVQFITTSPDKPVVKPSDGDKVTGCATPGSTVTVRDENGNVIGTATAGDDCKYTVTLSPKQDEGKTITVEVTDQAGNSSGVVPIRVGMISIVLDQPEIEAGKTQTAYGYGFQPGEKVSGELRSSPVDLGTQVADADGSVKFTFKLADDIEPGEHTVTLAGDFSGSVKETFNVVKIEIAVSSTLAVTGGDLLLPLSGAALLLVTGLGLIAAKRRKRETESSVL